MEITAKQSQTAESVKIQLGDIMAEINWLYLARDYFGKSPSWIYAKLNQRDGNGGRGDFTPEEKERLRGALFDLAERIRRSATNIQ